MSSKSDGNKLQVRFVESINEIDAQVWNDLAADESPFLRHEFLLALEQTGCTVRATGWQAHHAVVTEIVGNRKSEPVAFIPLYLKYNSFGEYVFDWSWADAYRANDLKYYPKLLSAIPFTPSTSSRLLHSEQVSLEQITEVLVQAIKAEAIQHGASSWHVLFPTPQESDVLAKYSIAQRKGCQFHWFNRGYSDFENYLNALSSRKRKNIRKEREAVSKQGIRFDTVEGEDISASQWKQFYVFYQSTYLVRGREGYLSQDLFLQVGKTMPENLVLILAKIDQQIIAGALFFKGNNRLYGRYWGSLKEYQFLHFETCFYRGIDYCIKQGIQQFDAGAQGEHKIQRGFEPVETYSNHWIANEAFSNAINEFLASESAHIENYMVAAGKLLPFKKG